MILSASSTVVYAEQLGCENRGGMQYICSLLNIQNDKIVALEKRITLLEDKILQLSIKEPIITPKVVQENNVEPPIQKTIKPIVKCETKIVNGVCVNLDLTINIQQESGLYSIFGISKLGEVIVTVEKTGELVYINQVTNVDGTYYLKINSSSWVEGEVYIVTVISGDEHKDYVINHHS